MLFADVIRTIRPFLNHLLPATCVLCGYTATNNLCQACQRSLPILSQHCPRCAKFLTFQQTQSIPLLCGACQQHPPPFDHTFALFPYEFPIIQLITALKFQQKLSHGNALSKQFITNIEQLWYLNKPLPDLILPVPLHPKRLQERGFNQALEIAKPIARYFDLPIDTKGLQRTYHTAAQSGLSAEERKRNVLHAFTATRRFDGLTIALIDDVVTTGQTVIACCEKLKSNGAKSIHVWCAARRG
jgi:ComF family protein